MSELELAPSRTPTQANGHGLASRSVAEMQVSLDGCTICGMPQDSKRTISGNGVEFRRCRSCGVVFRVPCLTPSDLEDYFGEDYITAEESLADGFGKRREEILSICAGAIETCKNSGRILDVGCAGGYFLNRFFRSPSWIRFGIEPSRLAARIASRGGIEIYQGQVCAVDLPESFFDVITLLDVLYYFTDPGGDLLTLRRALNPGGLLVIEVPLGVTQLLRHHTPIGRLLGGHPVPPLQRRHNYLFSSRSLAMLLERAGFEVKEVASLPGVRQPRAIQHLVHRSYYSVSRLLTRWSAGRLVGGPNCLVIASPAASQHGTE